jgi:hypothetical protein
MRRIYFLLLLLSISRLGTSQDKSKIIIDSLTRELNKANQIIGYAERSEKRLDYLLTAKEMALRSLDLKDSIFQALIAIQAYKFHTDHNGNYNDIEIYNALYSALKKFNDPLTNTLNPNLDKKDKDTQIKTMAMADKLCSYMQRNMLVSEWNRFSSHLSYEPTCPLSKSSNQKK